MACSRENVHGNTGIDYRPVQVEDDGFNAGLADRRDAYQR